MKKIEIIKDKIIVSLVYIITIILTVLLLSSCEKKEKNKENYVDGFNIIVVDSCEYITRSFSNCCIMGHKGNCRYCAERNKRMVREQVDSILTDIFD